MKDKEMDKGVDEDMYSFLTFCFSFILLIHLPIDFSHDAITRFVPA